MKELFYSSKDEIRNRVLKNARDHWGLKHVDDLDPMVRLFLEALCNEVFNISNEVKGLEQRIMDKLAKTLAVETLTGALPAHAILHARPVELSALLDEKDSFTYHMRLPKGENGGQEGIDLFFSPLRPVHIAQASVRFMATGNNLFSIASDTRRSLMAQGQSASYLAKNTVYIGIDWPVELTKLEGLTFYFDWPHFTVESSVIQLLALSKWSIAEQTLQMEQDCFYVVNRKPNSTFAGLAVDSVIAEHIEAYYRNRFFSIARNQQLAPLRLEAFPECFEAVFSVQDLPYLREPCLWIKIELPSAIPQQALDELFVSINAFPVVNRKLHELKHRLKAISDIIPMKTADYEQFLNVEDLRDLPGNRYSEIPQGYDDNRNAGLYSVRYGGIERFDERSAGEMLEYLLEVLRDERAAFATYGTDFLHSALTDLEQQISLISQRTDRNTSSMKGQVNYIVFKPLPKAEIMFLQYWTTNGAIANGLKTGSRLQTVDSGKLNIDSIYLLSSTVGGRDRLNAVNRTRAYKYGLVTANRIVTQRDLETFCWLEFGDYIQDVRISRGLYDSKNPEQGFIRTVDIIITPSTDAKLNEEEWRSILNLGLAKLRSRSVLTSHHRLFLSTGGVAV